MIERPRNQFHALTKSHVKMNGVRRDKWNRRFSSGLILTTLLLGCASIGQAQVYHVTNTDQSGTGSLAFGINVLNLGSGPGIAFADGLGLITLESALPAINRPGATTLTGTGNTVTAIGGFSSISPVFALAGSGSVTFSGFTVQGSNGGVYSGGSALTLQGAAVTVINELGTTIKGGTSNGAVAGSAVTSAIAANNDSKTITNRGTIEGGSATGNSGGGGVGLSLVAITNTVTNGITGAISGGTGQRLGGEGITITGRTNTVTNDGFIKGTGGAKGIAIATAGGIAGTTTITNAENALIVGGNGIGDNTNGGHAIEVTDNTTANVFSNRGAIQGGSSIYNHIGGTGVFSTGNGSTLSNFSSGGIKGGSGGVGIDGAGLNGPSDGGTGGIGVNLTGAGSTVTNAGTIQSGNGGKGGHGNNGQVDDNIHNRGGDGGASGAAVLLSGNASSVSNAGTIQAGNGGDGGQAGDWTSYSGGTGGVGGDSVSLSGTASGVHNTGTLLAGNGGRGGNITFPLSMGGTGGDGGIGVRIAGAGGQVTNEGTIQGGRYGDAGVGPLHPDTHPPVPQIKGIDGVGGMGIYFAAGSATVINSGTISGGLNFNGSHAEAIHFNGNGNRLEIRAGSVINGKVEFAYGVDNTLALGGTINSSFDATALGVQFRDYDTFLKTGSSTWTLTGTGSHVGSSGVKTVLQEGILNLGSAGALDNQGTLTFTGGTLQYSAVNTVDYSSRFTTDANQAYNINTNGQSVAFANGFKSANATLNKLGEGTLTLNSGATEAMAYVLSGGVLKLGTGGSLNPTSINFHGGTLEYAEGNTTDYSAYFSTTAGQKYSFDTNGQSVNVASDLTSSGGSLTKLGEGTLHLSGNNTLSAGITLAAGTLEVGSGNATGVGLITITGGVIRAAGEARAINNALALNGDFTVGRSTTLAGNAVLGADVTITSANPDAGASDTANFSGVISGSHGITVANGANPNKAIIFSGNNTYTGPTTIVAGSFLVEGSLTGTGLVDVTGGAIGGNGAIGGSIHFGLGAGIVFDPTKTLTINGATVTFDGFSMANVVGLDSTAALGTYVLLDGPAVFDFANVANFGASNAYDLGNGKFAYFQPGSLDVIVVPEPSTWALIVLGLGAVLWRARKLRLRCHD